MTDQSSAELGTCLKVGNKLLTLQCHIYDFLSVG